MSFVVILTSVLLVHVELLRDVALEELVPVVLLSVLLLEPLAKVKDRVMLLPSIVLLATGLLVELAEAVPVTSITSTSVVVSSLQGSVVETTVDSTPEVPSSAAPLPWSGNSGPPMATPFVSNCVVVNFSPGKIVNDPVVSTSGAVAVATSILSSSVVVTSTPSRVVEVRNVSSSVVGGA